MKVKTISVTYGRKFNLGNYESAEIAATLWADLDEAENEAERTAELYTKAKEAIREQALPLVKDRPNFKSPAGNSGGNNGTGRRE